MANPWFESVAEAQRRAKRRLPKGVYGALLAGSERGPDGGGQHRRLRRAGVRPARRRAGHDKRMATTVMGQEISLPVLISPDRRAGGAPRRRGRRRPRRGRPRHRDGPVLVRQQADRGGHRGQPADLLPAVLGRRPRRDGRAWSGRASGRRGRADRHPGLVVLLRPGLGQPAHPGEDRPARRCALRPAGADAGPRWLLRLRADREAARPDRAEHGRRRGAPAPTFFGAYGAVDADAAADLGRRRLAARAVGRRRSCSRASCRVDDARRAVDAGVTAISVSNHGGNNLDGTPATIRRAARDRRRPSATRSRCCSTAASGAAATSSRRSPWAPRRS